MTTEAGQASEQHNPSNGAAPPAGAAATSKVQHEAVEGRRAACRGTPDHAVVE